MANKKVEEIKEKLRQAKEDLEVKKEELSRLHREEIELISGGLRSAEEKEAFERWDRVWNTLLKRIKEEVQDLEKLLKKLEKAERGFWGWTWYVVSFPFRLIFDLIKGIIRALDNFDAEKAEALIESLLKKVAEKL